MSDDHEEAPTRSAPRRSSRGPSVFGELVKIVLGGVAGLVLGYYGLVYWGGPSYNFLHLKLPGLPAVHPAPVAAEPPAVQGEPEPSPSAAPSAEPDSATAAAPISPEGANSSVPGTQGLSPLPPDYLGPRDRKGYLPEDVGTALAEAHAAIGCPTCGSTGYVTEVVVTGVHEVGGRKIESKRRDRKVCPDCKGKPEYRLGEEAFDAWCRLGEVVALADDLGSGQRLAREQAIRDLLVQSVSTPEKAEEIGRWATARLDDPQRPSQGVLLAGRVLKTEKTDRLFAVRVALDATGREASVLSDTRPPFSSGAHVLLLAAIVESPQKNLGGYSGEEPYVLWLGQIVQGP